MIKLTLDDSESIKIINKTMNNFIVYFSSFFYKIVQAGLLERLLITWEITIKSRYC